jgi:SlyX protein
MSDELMARIEKLETIVAYQDAAIEELREALALHFREIGELRQQLARLDASLRIVEAHPALAAEPEPPPPHY